jgi:hypothetical protein
VVPDAYLQVLTIIYTRIKDTPINWAVIGSLNMALQGMPVAIHDIDLQTDIDGAYTIAQAMAEYVITLVRYLASERMRSHLGKLEVICFTRLQGKVSLHHLRCGRSRAG